MSTIPMLSELTDDILRDSVRPHLDVHDLGKLCQTNKNPLWVLMFRERQAILRHLQVSQPWCWIHPPADQCFDECEETRGALVKLTLRKGEHNVYRSVGSFYDTELVCQRTYLLHDDELKIRWVGCGLNIGGFRITGGDIEAAIMMHTMNPRRWDTDDYDYDTSTDDE